MSEPFIGSIVLFAGTFAPRGWALCQGQILSIAQNTALFSILGTTYGGNGQTTFALPDLRGRVPVGQGQGPGLSSYDLGEVIGTESVTLIAGNLPPHQHTTSVFVNSSEGGQNSPQNNFLGKADPGIYSATHDNSNMGAQPPTGLGPGSSQPVSILQPLLCLNFIIALEGIFPSRN